MNRLAISNIIQEQETVRKDMRVLVLSGLITDMDIARLNDELGFEAFQYEDLPENQQI